MSYRMPKVEYWLDANTNRWFFTMVAGNGEPGTAGQGYKTEAGCLSGIAAARRNWARAAIKRVQIAPSRR